MSIKIQQTVFKNNIEDNPHNAISANIGQMKGDLIIFSDNGNPVRFPAGNANGKAILTDSTTETGWVLGDVGSSAGASATLYNCTGATIAAGSVVTAAASNNLSITNPVITKATASAAGPYYVLLDNVSDTDTVQAAFVPGSVVSVLCDSAAVSQGDPLVVSATSGLATSLPGGTATIGIALSAKASGSTGLVKCKMVDAPIGNGINQDDVSNANGKVYEIVEGSTTAGYPDLVSARYGKQPFGVQANPSSAAAGSVLLHSRPGDIAKVMADSSEIKIGDWLVPSLSNNGYVRNGSGYGIGVALEAKASGSAGLIQCMLYPGQYRNSPRAWYLPAGISEAQVVAAWQFIHRDTEANALININEGTEYALSKVLETETWNADTGFYIPGTKNAGLNNATVQAMYESIIGVAFGYSGASIATTGNVYSGGYIPYRTRRFELKGDNNGYKYVPTITKRFTTDNDTLTYKAVSCYEEGVLSANFIGNDAQEMWQDGVQVTLTAEGYRNDFNANKVIGQDNNNHTVFAPFYVSALALYNTQLTASQMLELTQNIKAL